jgi:hypothetical protein
MHLQEFHTTVRMMFEGVNNCFAQIVAAAQSHLGAFAKSVERGCRISHRHLLNPLMMLLKLTKQ